MGEEWRPEGLGKDRLQCREGRMQMRLLIAPCQVVGLSHSAPGEGTATRQCLWLPVSLDILSLKGTFPGGSLRLSSCWVGH
jgi:hypothetical protein